MIYTPSNNKQYDIFLCSSEGCHYGKQFIVLPINSGTTLCPSCSMGINDVQFKFPEIDTLFSDKKNGVQVLDDKPDQPIETQIVKAFNLTEKFIKMLSKVIVLNHKVTFHIDESGFNTIVIQTDDKK